VQFGGTEREAGRPCPEDRALSAHLIDQNDRGLAADAGAGAAAAHIDAVRGERGALPPPAFVIAEWADVGSAQPPALQRDQRRRHLAARHAGILAQPQFRIDPRRPRHHAHVVVGVEAEADDIERRRDRAGPTRQTGRAHGPTLLPLPAGAVGVASAPFSGRGVGASAAMMPLTATRSSGCTRLVVAMRIAVVNGPGGASGAVPMVSTAAYRSIGASAS